MKKYGFIGCGNMGGALIRAAAVNIPGENILVADFLPEKAETVAAEVGAKVSSNAEIAEKCDYIFLGVKPQMMKDMLDGISGALADRKTRFVLVSMAAATTIGQIGGMLGADYPVIRIMPNTPAAVGMGMILYAASPSVSAQEKAEFITDMAGAGRFDEIKEGLIDAASAVSGCGPAFVCMFAEALADGGVECGLPRDKALTYAYQTLAGTAELLLKSGKHPGELKDAVCSPGGTTIAGVHALEAGGFRASAMDAVCEAYRRTLEIKENK